MPDVWIDVATPKDALLAFPLLCTLKGRGYETIVTARRQTQTTDVLDILGVPYTLVGGYGETLREKLIEEQKRTLEFVKLFDKIGLPKVLWTHGNVSAIRTAFGLQIPVVYSNDTLHAIHVAKLVCPLVDWLIAPLPFGRSWSEFGIPKSRIILYDGIEEVAWLGLKHRHPKFLEEVLQEERIVLFRNVEYKASYCKDLKVDVWELVKKLSDIATVIYLPRYEEEKQKIEGLNNVWIPPKPVLTIEILPYVDLVVSSGGTICRESALMGLPTVSFHFWDVIAIFLHKKGFPISHITKIEKIIKTTEKIMRTPKKYRVNTQNISKSLESPIPVTTHYIENYLMSTTTED